MFPALKVYFPVPGLVFGVFLMWEMLRGKYYGMNDPENMLS